MDGQTRDLKVQQISPRLYQDIEDKTPDTRLKNIHSIIPQPNLKVNVESSATKHFAQKGDQPAHLLLVNHKFSTPSNDQGKNNRIVSQRLKTRIEQQVEKKNFELVKKKVKSNNFFIEKQQPYIQTSRQINLCDSPTKDKKNLTITQIERKDSVPKQMAEFAKNYYASKKGNNQKSSCKLGGTKSQNTTPTRPKETSYLKIGQVQINLEKPPASSFTVQAKFTQNQTQRTSQPAIQSDSDWKDIRKFLEIWNLQLKQAKAYSQQEIIDFIRQVEQRIIEVDQVANYERMKANDFKDENNKLIEELNHERDNVRTLQRDYTLTQKDIEKQESFIQKLQECQQQLKQSQYQNLICLDFYKDIEAFIIENKFEGENDEFQRHIIKLELLLQDHGLHLMDFDTDRTQVLIDSIADLIFERQIEMENLEKELMDKSVDDELYGKNGVKFKINKVKKSQNLAFNNINFDKASNSRTQSQQRTESAKGSQPFNRHVLCCSGNVVAFKAEINHKNQIIQKQREQLEHRIKKITSLKVQLKKAQNNEMLIQEKLRFKESVVKLENEFNDQIIQNTKQQLENKNLKEENQKLLQEMVAYKEMNKKLDYEIGEIKKLLSTNEGFKKLEDTVMDLSNLLISKGQKHLNSSQKFLLQAIFGNSAILTKMKQRIIDSENYGKRMSSLLIKSLQIIVDFQDIIEDQWSILRQLYEALMQQQSNDKFIMSPDLYEILKFLKKNANESYLDQYERTFAGKLVNIKDIRNEISKEDTQNQMSRQMLEENDNTSLLSRMANRRLSDQRNKSCMNLCKTPEHDPLQFSDSKYQDDLSSKVQTQKINFNYDQPLKSEHNGRGSCNQIKLESMLGSIQFPEAPDDIKTTLLNKSKEDVKRKSPFKDSNASNRLKRKVTPKKHDSESSVIQRVYQVMNDQNELQDLKIVFGEEEQLLNPPLLDLPNLTEKSKSHSRSHQGKKTSYRVQYRILKEENENLRQRITELEQKVKDVPQQETLDSLNKNKKSAVSLPAYIEQLQKELEFDDSEKNMKAQILETSIRTTKENEYEELEKSDLYQMIQLQAHAFESNKEMGEGHDEEDQ